MATKVFDAVATVGTYTDRKGNEKKRYVTVGVVFENDKKQMSMKIECLPVGEEWNGWVSFYTPKEKGDGVTRDTQATGNTGGAGSFNDFEDDIPF